MAIEEKEFKEFEKLVLTSDSHTEKECAAYLHHAVGLLLPSPPIEAEFASEERNYFGSTDFVLSATLLSDANQEAIHAYIWELKSPQTFLFEKDDNDNRYRPTKEFAKAENQLLHYHAQAEGDLLFRQRFKATGLHNIKIGGIIIGRSQDRLTKNGGDNRKAAFALSVRENILYRSSGLRVFTWDRILDFVRATVR